MDGRTGEIAFQSGSNPIRHVIYILKENRTYDQIFGDIKEGNGDPSLVMYGEAITPNEHALARQFGLLDNFYDSGEVSGDGHPWSTSAIDNRLRRAGLADRLSRAGARVRLGRRRRRHHSAAATVMPDVNEPATGYLWGNLARHQSELPPLWRVHRDALVQGYSAGLRRPWSAALQPGSRKSAPWLRSSRARIFQPDLGRGKSPYSSRFPCPRTIRRPSPSCATTQDPKYPDFKVEYPDQFRADEFLREFAGFVEAKKSGKGTELPNFCLVRLPNDHTAGNQARLADAECIGGRQRSGGRPRC